MNAPRNPLAPDDYPRTRRAFLSADLFERERTTFFDQGWTCVGSTGQVPREGWFAAPAWGSSVLLSRDRTDQIRAFVNACPHRGARLLDPGTTHTRAVSCPYHAWTFDTEGRLRALPDRDGLPVSMEQCGLKARRVARVGDLLFVAGALTASPVEQAVGALAEDLTALGELGPPVGTLEIPIDANWKTVVCGVIEDYHLPYVHGRTLDPFTIGSARPFLEDGGHSGYRITLKVPTWLQRVLIEAGRVPEGQLQDYQHLLVAPNLTIGRCLGLVWTNRHDPVSVDHTVQRFTLYDPTAEAARGPLARGVREIRRRVTRRRHLQAFLEDKAIFESVSCGQQADPSTPWGPVHEKEPRVGHFLEAVAEHVSRSSARHRRSVET